MRGQVMGKKIGAFEALSRYALSRYGDEFEGAAGDCPYETRMGGKGALRQEISWFVYEWKNPATGTTILDEFVARRILKKGRDDGGKSERLAARLLLRKDITYDEFEVVAVAAAATGKKDRGRGGGRSAGRPTIRVRAQGTKKEYDMASPASPRRLSKGDRFVGRIHPRGDGTYSACGVLTRPGEWDRPKGAGAPDAGPSPAEAPADGISKRQSDSVAGDRRGRSMTEILEIIEKSMGTENPLKTLNSLGPGFVQDLLDHRANEDRAFDAAMSEPIGAESEIRQVLGGYPEYMLKTMCRELGVKSPPSREMMADRIAEELPEMVCMLLGTINASERGALAHVLRRGFVAYPECCGELARLTAGKGRSEPMLLGERPDDHAEGKMILQLCTGLGLLVVGTAQIGGRDQKIVTVASDIRMRIRECPGWD